MIRYFALVIGTMILNKSAAQELAVSHFVYQNGIAIRWFPANLADWKKLVDSGIYMNRITIARDGKYLEKSEKINLNPTGYFPNYEMINIRIAKGDSVAGFINAVLEDATDTNILSVGDLAKSVSEESNKMLFSILLLRADLLLSSDFGLAALDLSLDVKETYIYELFGKAMKDTIRFVAHPGQPSVFARPDPPRTEETESGIRVFWNEPGQTNILYGHFIERSDDSGRTFNRLHHTPIYYGFGNNQAVFLDTFSTPTRKTFYRLSLVHTFGTDTICSEQVGINPVRFDYCTPEKVTYNELKRKIEWEYNSSLNCKPDSVAILFSDSMFGIPVYYASGRYKENQSDTIKHSGYFRIVAYYNYGIAKESLPVHIQLADSTPPVKPLILQCTCDSAGVVNLAWCSSKETDLRGYQIYRSWWRNAEFECLTSTITYDTTFADTLSRGWFRDSVFYIICVSDLRYNQNCSDKTGCAVNHGVPPAERQLLSCYQSDRGVEIRWKMEKKKDIEFILHRSQANIDTVVLARLAGENTTFTDSSIAAGEVYSYFLQVRDVFGRKSRLSVPFTVKTEANLVLPPIEINQQWTDTTTETHNLLWTPPNYQVKFYRIYMIESGRYRTISTVPGEQNYFQHHIGVLNNSINCEYRVVAYTTDGRRSAL